MQKKDKKTVLILGSTGSIGTNTLSVVDSMPDQLNVVGLSAGSKWETLSQQVRKYRPGHVALAEESSASKLRQELGASIKVFCGEKAALRLVEEVEADVVVGAITGWAGFLPCLRALELGRTLALANKETLVVGGELVRKEIEEGNGHILPVDSEQSAIFQALCCGESAEIERVIVTASGGPFHGMSYGERQYVKSADALDHPNWDMGPKITIDSATMMNKALEVVETRWLFDLPPEQIDVLIHPQSIIHSMVEFVDGSIMAQMGAPDMRLPIQYALTWPDRTACCAESVDLGAIGELTLEHPGPEEKRALDLGYEVARVGGSIGAVFNAANEVAVDAFLKDEIAFTDIIPIVEKVVDEHKLTRQPDVDQLIEADHSARKEANKCLAQF